MSCMRCEACDRIVDTDYDVEGVWEESSPFRFWCARCSEDTSNDAMLSALKIQDPEAYSQMVEQ